MRSFSWTMNLPKRSGDFPTEQFWDEAEPTIIDDQVLEILGSRQGAPPFATGPFRQNNRMSVMTNCVRCTAWQSPRRTPMREILGDQCPFSKLKTRLSISKNQNLYHQGDTVGGLYSLSEGLVALERVDENGELVILKVLHPGALFPGVDLFGNALHKNGARALTDVKACFVPSERLAAALKDTPSLSLALLRQNSAEVGESEDAIFNLCGNPLPKRVLAALTALATEVGTMNADGSIVFDLPMYWRDFAAMVGTGPETISRLLRRLKSDGWLTIRNRKVILHAVLLRSEFCGGLRGHGGDTVISGRSQ